MKVDRTKAGVVRVETLDFGDCFLDTLGNCYIVVDEDFDADDEFFTVATSNGKTSFGYALAVNLETGSGTAFHNDELITPVHMVQKLVRIKSSLF